MIRLDVRLDMERKFENTKKRLQELNDHLKTNIVDQSVSSIKDTVIDALKEDNAQLRNKVELLEKKLTEVDISRNKLEKYKRRNNIDIQGIPPQIPDEKLEEKVIEVSSAMNIAITKNDLEDYHRLGKSSKSTIKISVAFRVLFALFLNCDLFIIALRSVLFI